MKVEKKKIKETVPGPARRGKKDVSKEAWESIEAKKNRNMSLYIKNR